MDIEKDNIRKILINNNCTVDALNMHSKRNLDTLFALNPPTINELADDPNINTRLTPSGRSDIPPISDAEDFSGRKLFAM